MTSELSGAALPPAMEARQDRNVLERLAKISKSLSSLCEVVKD